MTWTKPVFDVELTDDADGYVIARVVQPTLYGPRHGQNLLTGFRTRNTQTAQMRARWALTRRIRVEPEINWKLARGVMI